MRRQPQYDPRYIVRLTKQLVGSDTISRLEREGYPSPQALFLLFNYEGSKLRKALCKMNAETLGRICEHGVNRNFSEPLAGWSGFVRMTGIEDAVPNGYDPKLSGRELLETASVATVVTVLCDIVNQSKYVTARARLRYDEHFYDLMSYSSLRFG